MDWTIIRDIYTTIRYHPLPENNSNINGFTGFNLCELHRILLKFWYHSDQGLFHDISSPRQYLTDFLSRIDRSISTDTIPAMLLWMQLLKHLLSIVIIILTKYTQNTLRDYCVEDKNRVIFLAWERVLTKSMQLTDR
jgi:hypothetical protein